MFSWVLQEQQQQWYAARAWKDTTGTQNGQQRPRYSAGSESGIEPQTGTPVVMAACGPEGQRYLAVGRS